MERKNAFVFIIYVNVNFDKLWYDIKKFFTLKPSFDLCSIPIKQASIHIRRRF